MKGMSPKEKRAYICRYYWHYFLIGGIILGLGILLIYHLTLGNQNVHELDAMIIPESFYEYCQRQSGEFSETVELSDQSVLDKLGLRKPEDEKLLLCIPSDAKHPEEGKKFIEYISE